MTGSSASPIANPAHWGPCSSRNTGGLVRGTCAMTRLSSQNSPTRPRRIACVLDDSAPPDVWNAAWLETLSSTRSSFESIRPSRTMRWNWENVTTAWGRIYASMAALREEMTDRDARAGLGEAAQSSWLDARPPDGRSVGLQLCRCELLLGQPGLRPKMTAEVVADLRHALKITQELSERVRRSGPFSAHRRDL